MLVLKIQASKFASRIGHCIPRFSSSFWKQTPRKVQQSISDASDKIISKAKELKLADLVEDQWKKAVYSDRTRVQLRYAGTEENHQKVKKLTHLHNYHYFPTPYLLIPILQSVYEIQINENYPITLQRELVTMSDGGTVSLDWSHPENSIQNPSQIGPPATAEKIAIIIHGLAGGSECNYIRALVDRGLQEGYHTAVFHSRGVNDTKLTTPKPYDGDVTDFEYTLQQLRERYPNAQFHSIGASFGGNLLVRYLGKTGPSSIISAGVALSPPFDIKEAATYLEGNIYEKFLIKKLKDQIVKPNLDILKNAEQTHNIKMENVLKSTSLRQFYSELHCKLFGFATPEDYSNSLKITEEAIKNIECPLLVMQAKDDPIVTHSQVPTALLQENPHIIYAETSYGSHHCWLEGWKPQRWYPKPTYQFLNLVEYTRRRTEDEEDAEF